MSSPAPREQPSAESVALAKKLSAWVTRDHTMSGPKHIPREQWERECAEFLEPELAALRAQIGVPDREELAKAIYEKRREYGTLDIGDWSSIPVSVQEIYLAMSDAALDLFREAAERDEPTSDDDVDKAIRILERATGEPEATLLELATAAADCIESLEQAAPSLPPSALAADVEAVEAGVMNAGNPQIWDKAREAWPRLKAALSAPPQPVVGVPVGMCEKLAQHWNRRRQTLGGHGPDAIWVGKITCGEMDAFAAAVAAAKSGEQSDEATEEYVMSLEEKTVAARQEKRIVAEELAEAREQSDAKDKAWVLALAEAEQRGAALKKQLDDANKYLEDRCMGLTIGNGLMVWGSFEAINRAQCVLLIDSGHPQEKEDVRRSLHRSLIETERQLAYANKQLTEMQDRVDVTRESRDNAHNKAAEKSQKEMAELRKQLADVTAYRDRTLAKLGEITMACHHNYEVIQAFLAEKKHAESTSEVNCSVGSRSGEVVQLGQPELVHAGTDVGDSAQPPKSENDTNKGPQAPEEKIAELTQHLSTERAAREAAEATCAAMRAAILPVVHELERVGDFTDWRDGDETDRVYPWYEIKPLKAALKGDAGASLLAELADKTKRLALAEAENARPRGDLVAIGEAVRQRLAGLLAENGSVSVIAQASHWRAFLRWYDKPPTDAANALLARLDELSAAKAKLEKEITPPADYPTLP
jgi:hypothetical protein